jgi:hypothetical protein
MEFETLSAMALGTAFLSVAAATSAYLASPRNWWLSVLLGSRRSFCSVSSR